MDNIIEAASREIRSLTSMGGALDRLFLAQSSVSPVHGASKVVNSVRGFAVLCKRQAEVEIVVGVNRTAAVTKPHPQITVAYRDRTSAMDEDENLFHIVEDATSQRFEMLSENRLSTYLTCRELSLGGLQQHIAIVERLFREYYKTKRSKRRTMRNVFLNYAMIATFAEQRRRLEFGIRHGKFVEFLTTDPPNFSSYKCTLVKVKLDDKQWKDISTGIENTMAQLGEDFFRAGIAHDSDYSNMLYARYGRAKHQSDTRKLIPEVFEFVHMAMGCRLTLLINSANYLKQCLEKSVRPDWEAAKKLPFPCAAKRISYTVNQLWPLWLAYTTFIDKVIEPTKIDTLPNFSDGRVTASLRRDSAASSILVELLSHHPSVAAHSTIVPLPANTVSPASTAPPTFHRSINDIRGDAEAERIKYELPWGSALLNWMAWVTDHADSALTLLYWQRGHQHMELMSPIELYHSESNSPSCHLTTCETESWRDVAAMLRERCNNPPDRAQLEEIMETLSRASMDTSFEALEDCLNGCGAFRPSVPLEVELLVKFAHESFKERPGFILNSNPFITSPGILMFPFPSALMLDAMVERIWGLAVPKEAAVRPALPETPGLPTVLESVATVDRLHFPPEVGLKTRSSLDVLDEWSRKLRDLSRTRRKRRMQSGSRPENPMDLPSYMLHSSSSLPSPYGSVITAAATSSTNDWRRQYVGWAADVTVSPRLSSMSVPDLVGLSDELRSIVEDAVVEVANKLEEEITGRLIKGKDEWDEIAARLVPSTGNPCSPHPS